MEWTQVLAAPAGTQRRLAFLIWLDRRVRECGGVPPFVVGGAAVEIYTQGGYTTGDVDLKCPERSLSSILADVGFVKKGRLWVHPGADLWIDRVGEGPEAPHEIASKAVELCLMDGSIWLIGPEDLVLDRLRAAVHWKDEDSLVWAGAIVRSVVMSGRDFDWRSVEERLEDDAERAALRLLMESVTKPSPPKEKRPDEPTP